MDLLTTKQSELEIPGPCGPLEAIVLAPNKTGTLFDYKYFAVICHPHPQHGGTMNNKVVTTLARIYRDLGVPVIYFNFRGVGASAGEFDNAVGEVDDLLAVIKWAEQQLPARKLLLAGFSFGSSVAGLTSQMISNLAHLTFVAPPVGKYRFTQSPSFPAPVCVIQGDLDDVVDPRENYRWVNQLTTSVDVIRDDEAGHFFHGRLKTIRQQLPQILTKHLIKKN